MEYEKLKIMFYDEKHNLYNINKFFDFFKINRYVSSKNKEIVYFFKKFNGCKKIISVSKSRVTKTEDYADERFFDLVYQHFILKNYNYILQLKKEHNIEKLNYNKRKYLKLNLIKYKEIQPTEIGEYFLIFKNKDKGIGRLYTDTLKLDEIYDAGGFERKENDILYWLKES